MLKSVEGKEVALKLVKSVTDMCQKGGFKLTKFISNIKEVLTTIPEERHHQKIKHQDLNTGDLPVKRALGVHWNIENDYLGFKINPKGKPPLQSAQYMIHLGQQHHLI